MRFKFTGNANAVIDPNAKGYFDRSGTSQKTKEPYTSVSFSVASTKNNRGYVEIFGMEKPSILTFDNDDNQIEISWEDRNSEGVLKTVRQKSVMNFTEDGRKEFIADLDVANFIKDHIHELNKKKVTVTGTVNPDFYQGKMRDRFTIQNIFAAEDNVKTGLNIYGEFYFTKDSIDTADWKSDHKIIINGYTFEYVASEKKKKGDKDKGKRYVPRTLIFDCSKIDWENEKHVAIVNFRLAQIGLKYENGSIVNNLKSKNVYKTNAIISYVRGQEEIPFDESELTENQKTAIELGVKTLDDFKPKGQIYGESKVEYKLVDFDIRGDFTDGCVAIKEDRDTFEENIYIPSKPQSEDEVFMNVPEEVKKDKDDSEDDVDLFA